MYHASKYVNMLVSIRNISLTILFFLFFLAYFIYIY